ncbi:PREDICTED: alkylglycerol monooxygenase isoform X1 [Corvus brachyrhynchos]|uniref:alkylglycerol monooxygenase isoform X1 n=1 Tax=Corvus brachyrhynchos TaxID=85066 RepID=UPI000816559E|nr:PREDICTED: alkylglycerol monooxygenase isoform X1 [Corvus brachyrhynchos]
MGAEAGSPRDTALGQQLRALFYALLPGESSFRTVEEVPNYVDKSIPFFITFIGLEFAVSWIQKRKLPGRINDGITSLSLGILSRLPDVLFRSIDLISYIYVWNNYRLLELPWDSPWTWYLTLLGVDFAYYCFHRISHEVNILWAAHQVHHSSEDYNLFTALRQSVLQKYTSWMFNLPMALFIPPSVFAVHLQFNLLYQFWIHTEVITKLGPLEWILNTPSHHRVHHGRNPYCIDKNYGGTLIIWDRIFGTFEAEDEKVVYGLTHPVNSFDPIMLQLRPLAHIWNTFWATPGFCNKLSVIFKGPGWGPGKPRLGLPEEIPVITGKEVPFNPPVPAYCNCYALVHFAIIVDLYTELLASVSMLSQGTVLLRIGFIILSLSSFGLLMENKSKAGILEMIRCLVFIGVYKLGYFRSQFSVLGYAYEKKCVCGKPCSLFFELHQCQSSATGKYCLSKISWKIDSYKAHKVLKHMKIEKTAEK